MGPLSQLVNMLPGAGKISEEDIDEKAIVRMQAILDSMTKKEREFPQLIDGKRKKRIAKGSGTLGAGDQPAPEAVPADEEDDEDLLERLRRAEVREDDEGAAAGIVHEVNLSVAAATGLRLDRAGAVATAIGRRQRDPQPLRSAGRSGSVQDCVSQSRFTTRRSIRHAEDSPAPPGATHSPFYRVVVSDSLKTPSASTVEQIGHYDPKKNPADVKIDHDARRLLGQQGRPALADREVASQEEAKSR